MGPGGVLYNFAQTYLNPTSANPLTRLFGTGDFGYKAVARNAGLNFVCRDVALTVENAQSAFTSRYAAGETVHFPVAHHDGNYVADAETLDRLEGEGRVAFRYGEAVNGSARNIAGILNAAGNVLGMMPHPERKIELAHGGTDGRRLFEGVLETIGA